MNSYFYNPNNLNKTSKGINDPFASTKTVDDQEEENSPYNASHYPDPTAYQAIRNIDWDEQRFYKLLKTIFSVCTLAGFRIENRLEIVDLRTGRRWN